MSVDPVVRARELDEGREPEPAQRREPGVDAPRRASLRVPPTLVLVAFWVVGLVMPGIMLREVLHSSNLQWGDFWTSLTRFTTPDGHLHVRGFFTTQNHHPVFLPQMLFYVVSKWFQGSNVLLGVIDVVMTLVTTALAWVLLPRSIGRWLRASLTVLASVLLFSLHGIFNFGFGMSGIAWFGANIFTLLAIWAARSGRVVIASVFCVGASTCYGTGYASWVCVALMAFLLGMPWWKRLLPLVVLLLTVGLAARGYGALPVGGQPTPDIATKLGVFLNFFGSLASSGGDTAISTFVGATLLGVGGWCIYRAVLTGEHLVELTPWIAVFLYSLCAGALVSQARDVLGSVTGASSRYTSLAALMWLAVAVLAVVTWRVRLSAVVAGGVAVALLTTATSASTTQSMHDNWQPQLELKAIALRLGISDTVPAVPVDAAAIPRAAAMGIYPFTQDFEVGCAPYVSGTTVAASAITPMVKSPTSGGTDSDEVIGSGRVVKGWSVVDNSDPDCVMVVDSAGRVVGGGLVHVPYSAINSKVGAFTGAGGFTAIVPTAAGAVRVLVVRNGKVYGVSAPTSEASATGAASS